MQENVPVRNRHVAFHDAIIESISVLRSGNILRIELASVDVYESDEFVDAYKARLTLYNPQRIMLDGLWNGECSVNDGFILDSTHRSLELVDLIGKRLRIEKLIIDIISYATLFVDTAEVEFELLGISSA